MAPDPRDTLWEAVFDTYYSAYFEEILSDLLINRWLRIDIGVRVGIALTASGSAVAGWTLWERPDFKIIWAIISCLAAVGAIFHSTISVPSLLKEHTRSNKDFTALRHEFETLRNDLNINPQFDVTKKNHELKALKKRYTELCNNSPHDILSTDKLANKAQGLLNSRIADIIESKGED